MFFYSFPGGSSIYITLQKNNVDTKNCHLLRELSLQNHFGYPAVSFSGGVIWLIKTFYQQELTWPMAERLQLFGISYSVPIRSMYGIFTYICLIFMVNVGKYIPVPWILWGREKDQPFQTLLISGFQDRYSMRTESWKFKISPWDSNHH